MTASSIKNDDGTGAKAHPAVARLTPQTAPAGSWFADWVGTQAAALARSNTSTMRVRTTLMPEVQRLAQEWAQSLREWRGLCRQPAAAQARRGGSCLLLRGADGGQGPARPLAQVV